MVEAKEGMTGLENGDGLRGRGGGADRGGRAGREGGREEEARRCFGRKQDLTAAAAERSGGMKTMMAIDGLKKVLMVEALKIAVKQAGKQKLSRWLRKLRNSEV